MLRWPTYWCALRRIALADTEFEQATCGTIRLKQLQIGALVTNRVRRIKVAMASACPAQGVLAEACEALSCAAGSAA